jgi:hypothetical protein
MRFIACAVAVGWAYVGVFAIRFHAYALVGPAAASFVLALFAAASLEEFFDEPVEEGAEGDEGHDADGLFFASPRDGNR